MNQVLWACSSGQCWYRGLAERPVRTLAAELAALGRSLGWNPVDITALDIVEVVEVKLQLGVDEALLGLAQDPATLRGHLAWEAAEVSRIRNSAQPEAKEDFRLRTIWFKQLWFKKVWLMSFVGLKLRDCGSISSRWQHWSQMMSVASGTDKSIYISSFSAHFLSRISAATSQSPTISELVAKQCKRKVISFIKSTSKQCIYSIFSRAQQYTSTYALFGPQILVRSRVAIIQRI